MKDKYLEILKFIPIIDSENIGDSLAVQMNCNPKDNVIELPSIHYSDALDELMSTISRFVKANRDMNLTEYNRILNEHGIEKSSSSLAGADVSQLDEVAVMALLVAATRAERFCTGAFGELVKSGCVLKWLKRLEEIAQTEQNLQDEYGTAKAVALKYDDSLNAVKDLGNAYFFYHKGLKAGSAESFDDGIVIIKTTFEKIAFAEYIICRDDTGEPR